MQWWRLQCTKIRIKYLLAHQSFKNCSIISFHVDTYYATSTLLAPLGRLRQVDTYSMRLTDYDAALLELLAMKQSHHTSNLCNYVPLEKLQRLAPFDACNMARSDLFDKETRVLASVVSE